MRRVVMRWQTPFGQWVSSVGAQRLACEITQRGLRTAPTTVYGWLAGEKSPTVARAMIIVQVSGGRVRLEDVFAHRSLVRP